MKQLILAVLFAPCILQAQDITGNWNGLLKVQGMEMRLVFHITQQDSTWHGTMDSPDEKAFGIPVSSVRFGDSVLTIEIDRAGIRYEGRFTSNDFDGQFLQSGQSFPLRLTRNALEKKALNRPQEPVKPYPYLVEEVTFPSEGGTINLAGTLTLPGGNKKFPAVILITGSGPQTRDEEFMTHKPFLVLADHLTRNGIAVLRYDDRGFGQSTGNHGKATSADFANDVRAALAYLETRSEIDHEHTGLVGHSEGGLIAPMVANDTKTAFIVLLAAPAVPGSQVLLQQVTAMGKAQEKAEETIRMELELSRGVFDLFAQYGQDESFENKLKAYLEEEVSKDPGIMAGSNKEAFIRMQVSQFRRPWLRYFLQYDPAMTLRNVQCPVLALNGGKDVQVASDNLPLIEKAIRQGGNNRVTTKEFPNMNHLFQTCKTGAMDEYATIEETIDPIVLNMLSNWVLNTTK